MGWSATLERNQPCLSLGHPGRFDKVRGPVVRFGRIVEPLSPVKGFTQTTCLMEPGDSGGPLFDLAGRIIGIHSMVFQSPENNYEVPVDQFRRYWEELNQPNAFRARDDSKIVFAHDAKLKPSECGGPLFGLGGDLVGINVARFSRSRSYAIPAHVVKRFVLETVGKQRAL